MEDFFIGDPHLDHEAIRVHCKRPFPDLQNMNEKIVSNINSVVSRKDRLHILGDLAWKNHGHWIHAINGKKVLVPGNHDKMNQNHLRCFSNDSGDPHKDRILELHVEKHWLILCHYPMVSWNASPHGSWHLYAHCHGRYVHPGLAMDVGMDTNNFMPYHWNDIKKRMYDKILQLRIASGRYIGWKQVNQVAGIGITAISGNRIVCVMHKGIDNISDPYEAERLVDENGDYFCFGGHKIYESEVNWKHKQ